MRLLIDENLSPRVAAILSDSGIDAVHVLDRGLGGQSDVEVSRLAVNENRAIVSADSDFTTLLALSHGTAPSLILLRSGDRLKPDAQAALLLVNLPSLEQDLIQGVVVSLSSSHVRVRNVPLR